LQPGAFVAVEFVERLPGEWVITSVTSMARKQGSTATGTDLVTGSSTYRPLTGSAMLNKIIDWSGRNIFIVLLATLFITIGGIYAVKTPIDALPDLSDVQVIVYTEYPGQAPQAVEDQVTYPLTTAMLSVPKSKVVRGFSFFGASFVYVIFEDGTDIYWARSRVLEYLNFASGRMPKGVTPQIGPDATGVGWVYQYAVLAKNKTLAELRTLQDWYVRYQLAKAHGVAEGVDRWIRSDLPSYG
jgi:Cu(I)/Ag(I) efflux system membrane protein CusA/SilA